MKYVLITAARNEESFITKTLDSVTAQTQLPEHWVIIDDGSTDRTAEIIENYVSRFPGSRSFGVSTGQTGTSAGKQTR